MSEIHDAIQVANAEQVQLGHDSNKEFLEELERNRIANDVAMKGDPKLVWFKARRKAQKEQNLKVLPIIRQLLQN